MTATTRFPGPVHVAGRLSCQELDVPAGSVETDDFAASCRMPTSKQVHRFTIDRLLAAHGVDVADVTALLHVAQAAGTVVSLKAVCAVAPTGGDKLFTVDLQKSTGGGAFASILDAPLEISVAESSADRVPQEAVIDTDAFAADDLLQIVVDASGSTGSQGQGLLVTLIVDEDPV